ncbi:MAG: hypothetical protein ACK6EB_06810, partial [Planctomyces sp.]
QPIEHAGLVQRAACSADGRFLTVVNYFDGAAGELNNLLRSMVSGELSAEGETLVTDGVAIRASLVRYDLQNGEVTFRRTVRSMIHASAQTDDWVAVVYESAEGVIPNRSSHLITLINLATGQEISHGGVLSLGGVGMSSDGVYLAVSAQNGGFLLLERTDDGLVQRAGAGTGPLSDQVL